MLHTGKSGCIAVASTEGRTMDRATDWFKSATGKYKRKDYLGAIADYTAAINLKPDYAEAYYDRGNAKDGLGDYQGAVADFTKAIELNPDYAQAYNKRGFAYLMLGPKSKARADFKRAIELGYRVPQEALDACK